MGKYALERVDRLNAAKINPDKNLMCRKTISVSEKGVVYVVDVNNEALSVVYPIDGAVKINGPKCDKFIAALKEDDGIAVFLELKGKDINHAIQQLESTINNSFFRPYPTKEDKIRARIVSGGTAGPNSPSNILFEKARIRFLKLYNIELKRLKTQQPDIPISF